MLLKVAAVVVFFFEVCLSHARGDVSGNQSKWLSEMTGVKEGLLRRAAHVILFAALSLTAGLAWEWIGIGAVVLWSMLDEVTKIPIPGRHFSWPDVALNACGCIVGAALFLLVRKV